MLANAVVVAAAIVELVVGTVVLDDGLVLDVAMPVVVDVIDIKVVANVVATVAAVLVTVPLLASDSFAEGFESSLSDPQFKVVNHQIKVPSPARVANVTVPPILLQKKLFQDTGQHLFLRLG